MCCSLPLLVCLWWPLDGEPLLPCPEPAAAASGRASCCCWLVLQLPFVLAAPPLAAAEPDASVLKVLLVVLPFAAAPACCSACCCAVAAAVARWMRSPVDGERRFIMGRLASAAMAYVAARFISSLTALQQTIRTHQQSKRTCQGLNNMTGCPASPAMTQTAACLICLEAKGLHVQTHPAVY
jgi:hypothetical protein